MPRIALCDDDAQDRERAATLLHSWLRDRELSGSVTAFSSGKSLLNQAEDRGGFHLYLLDIIMPGEDGISIGRELHTLFPDSLVIYLTNSAEYALEAFDARAFHYLLKPLEPARLYAVLDEAMSLFQRRREDFVVLHTKAGEKRLPAGDILYAELRRKRVCYHLRNGDTLESVSLRCSFSEGVAGLLDRPAFVLCGASYAVNLEHIEGMEKSLIRLTGGKKLALPKRACAQARARWMDYWTDGSGPL